MNQYDKGFLNLILLFFIFFSSFLVVGLKMAKAPEPEYTLPIYISKEVTISGFSSYTVEGELTNLTNEDIKVDELSIRLSGSDDDTKYYALESLRIENFVVPANSKYEIYFDDVVYVKMGEEYAHGELTEAKISECMLNGESVELKEKDGEHFVSQGEKYTSYESYIFIGIVGVLGAVPIIIYKIKDKYTDHLIKKDNME